MIDIHTAAATACDQLDVIYSTKPHDGLFHRLDVKGQRPGNGNASILIYSDGEGGQVWNHSGGSDTLQFWAKSDQTLTPAEIAKRRQRAQAERERAEALLAEKRARAARLAACVWAKTELPTDNPYLIRKQVSPTSTLRQIRLDDLVSLLGYHPKSKGGKQLSGEWVLIAPISDGGKMTSIEMIDTHGLKAGLYRGQRGGCFWSTSKLPAGDGAGLIVGIAEGVATVLSYHAAGGNIGIAALSCGNLKSVAKYMRGRYPDARIEVISDVGNGEQCAIDAAKDVNGWLVKPAVGSDINDLQVELGKQAVADCIQAARQIGTEGNDELITSGSVRLIRGSGIKPKRIGWLWKNWVARGKYHTLAGQPGTGKTTAAVCLGATFTRGGILPDGTRAPVGSVVMWSGEDDIEDTLVPRFIAAGADMDKVYFVEGRKGEPFDPSKDMAELAATVKRIPDAALLIIDPVVSAVNGDSHKNAEVRKSLQPLVDLGNDTGVAIVGITHFSKSNDNTKDPLGLVSGSIAFSAVARVVLGAAKVRNPDELGFSRIFCRIKSNIGPDEDGIGYDLQMVDLPGHDDIEASTVKWGAYITGHSRDLLTPPPQNDDRPTRANEAADFLKDLLADGSVPQKTVEEQAAQACISMRTLNRAKVAIGVISRKVVTGWVWELQNQDDHSRLPSFSSKNHGNVGNVGNVEPQESVKDAKDAKDAKKTRDDFWQPCAGNVDDLPSFDDVEVTVCNAA